MPMGHGSAVPLLFYEDGMLPTGLVGVNEYRVAVGGGEALPNHRLVLR